MNNPYFIYWLMNGRPPSGAETLCMIIGMIVLVGLMVLITKLCNKPKKKKKAKK